MSLLHEAVPEWRGIGKLNGLDGAQRLNEWNRLNVWNDWNGWNRGSECRVRLSGLVIFLAIAT